MKSWEALDAEPKPSWETWKRILRMPHIDHDPKRAKEQWDKILENHAKEERRKCLTALSLKSSIEP